MVLDRRSRSTKTARPSRDGSACARQRAGDVRDAGGVVRAQGLPELLERRAVCRARFAATTEARRRRASEPRISVRRHSSSRALGPGERLKPRERLATPLDQPRGLVAVAQECLEGVFGEAGGR